MVLYWFGHAPVERLGDAKGDLVIQGWDMPPEFLWPTGQIGYRRNPNQQQQHHPPATSSPSPTKLSFEDAGAATNTTTPQELSAIS
jgi:hypothetical protein